MTHPIGYWCPECGDLKEIINPFPWIDGKAFYHGGCHGLFIPVYKPLAVPEVTTWGESGGDEAVCFAVPHRSRTGHYTCQSMAVRSDVVDVIISGPLVRS